MKILGTKSLDNNDYLGLSIYGTNVNVFGRNHKESLIVSEPFTQSLDGKTDQEQTQAVVEYYLRNRNICLLHDGVTDFSVQSESGVDLSISKGELLTPQLLESIYQKYSEDRMRAFTSGDIEVYYLYAPKEACVGMDYSVGLLDDSTIDSKDLPEDFFGKKCMPIRIGVSTSDDETQKQGIIDCDSTFLDRLVEDAQNVEYYDKSKNLPKSKNIFKCTIDGREVYLIISMELIGVIISLLAKSKKQKDYMKLQYRMENLNEN